MHDLLSNSDGVFEYSRILDDIRNLDPMCKETMTREMLLETRLKRWVSRCHKGKLMATACEVLVVLHSQKVAMPCNNQGEQGRSAERSNPPLTLETGSSRQRDT